MKKITFKLYMVLTASSLFLGLSGNAQAEIFKCVNAAGETYYNDKACPTTDKQTTLKNVKDPVNGYIPPAFFEEEKSKRSKGVVVGEGVNSNDVNSTKDQISDDSSLLSRDGEGENGTSGNADSINSNENIIDVANASETPNRAGKERVNSIQRPVIPLKTEVVTREPRDNLSKQ